MGEEPRFLAEMLATAATERPLWLTLPGGRVMLAPVWVAWVALAAVGGATGGGTACIVVVLAIGWLLARWAALPASALVRVHLDEVEAIALGPGRRVRRLPWQAVERVTQERGALRLEGAGLCVRIPLAPLVRSHAWGAVLTRVVPALATEMWEQLEDGGEVRLSQTAEPSLAALVWWSYAPVLLACTAGAGPRTALLALGLALLERGAALAVARGRTTSLRPSGLHLRSGMRRLFVPWSRADVMHAPRGLLVGPTDGDCGLVAASLPNFCAAAPVIEMRTRLGAAPGATVHFRVRLAEGRLAVVGEIDPVA